MHKKESDVSIEIQRNGHADNYSQQCMSFANQKNLIVQLLSNAQQRILHLYRNSKKQWSRGKSYNNAFRTKKINHEKKNYLPVAFLLHSKESDFDR